MLPATPSLRHPFGRAEHGLFGSALAGHVELGNSADLDGRVSL
jgi:hypothetical protein